jgi:hypothetical protein
MNIALLNIPFAIVGVAIAIVPLIIGMNYQSRTDHNEAVATKVDDFTVEPHIEELERAA